MGEQEFLIQRKYAPRELKKKHIRIAEAIAPLLKKCGPGEFRKAKEDVEGLIAKRHLNRRSLFSTLQSLGFEPVDARQTPLFDVVPGLIPVRTIAEAWNTVEENLGLVNMVIRYGARRGAPAGPAWEDKRGVVIRQMFENALYWDGRAAFSTYVFSCAWSSINEMDKMIGPYVIPRGEIGLIGRIMEVRRAHPGISNSELAEKLGADQERIRALDIGRASRFAAGMDYDNIFYSGGEDDGNGQRKHRISHSEIDSSHFPPSPEARLEREEAQQRVGVLLASLPADDQKILRGVFGIGVPKRVIAELAEELGCTSSALQVRLDRLLRRIRNEHGEGLSELRD